METLKARPAEATRDKRPDSRFQLSIRHLWLLVPFVWMGWVIGRPVSDNSFLWHVRAGTAQLDAGQVLTTDPFSYTLADQPWRTQSWLAELGYGYLENVTGGIGWVHVVLMLVVTLTMVAAGAAVYRATAGSVMATAGALLVIAWQGSPFTVPRPVIFSYLGLALVALVLQREDDDLWVLPPLIWAWAAVHGSFVLGIGLIVLDAVRRRSPRRGLTAGAALILASLTAHGLGVWQILIDFLGARGALSLIDEWKPPDFSNPFVLPYALVLGALLVATAKGKVKPRDLIVLAPFAFFGLLANRNLYPAIIILTPFAARALVRETPRARQRTELPLFNWVIAAAIVAFTVVGFNRPVTLNESRFPPQEVIDLIDDGNVFHGTAMGGYLIYAQWPERTVFIDDRGELFGEDGFREFHDLRNGCTELVECSSGASYREVFARYGIDQAVLEPQWPLVGDLIEDGWVETYRDEDLVILDR